MINIFRKTSLSNVYHYCKLYTFIEHIMKDKALKFNSLENSNDPNEYKEINPSFIYDPENIPLGDDEDLVDTSEKLNKIISKTKMICFSTDEPDRFSKITNEGWNLPRMWNSYGDSHRGICIELNISSLIEENSDILNSRYVYKDIVHYHKKLNYPILKKYRFGSDEEAMDFLIQNREQYFFQKHIDWIGEREFRIITFDNEIDYLKINSSIKKIILGERSPDVYSFLIKRYFQNKLYRISFNINRREYDLKHL